MDIPQAGKRMLFVILPFRIDVFPGEIRDIGRTSCKTGYVSDISVWTFHFIIDVELAYIRDVLHVPLCGMVRLFLPFARGCFMKGPFLPVNLAVIDRIFAWVFSSPSIFRSAFVIFPYVNSASG